MVKVLPWTERTSPHELVEISGEKLICGTELAFKFSFSAHPSVLYILRVHCVVIRTNEVSVVDNHRMHVDAASKTIEIGISSPAVRHDVGPREQMARDHLLQCVCSSVVNLNSE